jgi:hypothetical protein
MVVTDNLLHHVAQIYLSMVICKKIISQCREIFYSACPNLKMKFAMKMYEVAGMSTIQI